MENSTVDQPTSAMGIKLKTNSSKIITILLAKNSNRYRIQSNSLASLSLAMEQMTFRLHKHYNNTDDFRLVLGSSLPGNEIIPYITAHFKSRQMVVELEVGLFLKLLKYCCLFCRKNFKNTVGCLDRSKNVWLLN